MATAADAGARARDEVVEVVGSAQCGGGPAQLAQFYDGEGPIVEGSLAHGLQEALVERRDLFGVHAGRAGEAGSHEASLLTIKPGMATLLAFRGEGHEFGQADG